MLVNTFYFVSALLLLERGEGTFAAQSVTPLRADEYLASKVVTLTALSLVESLLIATAVAGLDGRLVVMALGIALAAVLFCLAGVALVVHYESINEFIMPSVLYTAILSLPMLGYFGVGAREWYLPHPIQGPLELMQMQTPHTPGGLAYAIGYPALWIVAGLSLEPPRAAPAAKPMRTAAAFRSLGAIDARNVARDAMLRWIAVFTPAFGLLFRFAVPPIGDALDRRFGFDLVAYYPLLMSFLPLIAAGMIGTVVGFLLLDQRDDQTLTALLVTPLSLRDYLRYRLGGLMLLSAVFGAAMMPLAGLTETTALQVVVSAVTAAPLAPIYALFLGTFAANKVQGFALGQGRGRRDGAVHRVLLRHRSVAERVRTRAALLGAESLLAVRRGGGRGGAGPRADRAGLAGGAADGARAAFLACRAGGSAEQRSSGSHSLNPSEPVANLVPTRES